MTETAQIPRRLPLLDGLRGFAAIAVMLYHLGNVFGFSGPFSRSYLFVDFFFLLSGFVLTLSAEARMNAGWGTRGFMRARIKRLWPMIAVGALLGAVAATAILGFEGVPAQLVLALLLIPMVFGRGQIFPLNGPQWSLLFEIIANLCHGLILRRLSDRAVLGVAVGSGIALALATLALGSNTTGPFAHNWWFGLPRVAFAYTLGVWIGRKWMASSPTPLVSWTTALSLPLIVMIMLPGLPIGAAVGDAVAVIVVMPVLFWLAATSETPAEAEPWLSRLGGLSFPLYAVHLPVLELFGSFSRSWQGALAAVAVCLLTAHVLAVTIERGDRRLRRRTRGPAQTAAAPSQAT